MQREKAGSSNFVVASLSQNLLEIALDLLDLSQRPRVYTVKPRMHERLFSNFVEQERYVVEPPSVTVIVSVLFSVGVVASLALFVVAAPLRLALCQSFSVIMGRRQQGQTL